MTAPTARYSWFLPSGGDGRRVSTNDRRPTLDYLGQVARAADQLGFHGVLTPTGAFCEDAWMTCAALAPQTERLRFIVAFRPGFVLPTLAAQQAATLQRISGGRLILNIVTGGNPAEQAAYGDHCDHAARYRRTGEFLDVVRAVWDRNGVNYDGEFYEITEGGLVHPPDPAPPIFFGGASDAAENVAAKSADVFLCWGETPQALTERIERVRAKADAAGREIRFGLRIHVIARERAADAWAEADRLLQGMSPKVIEASRERFARMDSVGQSRMAALHASFAAGASARASDLVVAPNLWAGIGLVRDGAGTALVGSFDEVAERLDEYRQVGFEHFILSGWPHLEEAYTVGEGLLPLLGATADESDGAAAAQSAVVRPLAALSGVQPF